MIGNILIGLQNRRFNPRGKQRALIVLDRIFGPFTATTPDGIKLRVFPSSSMDASYFSAQDPAFPGANLATLISLLPVGGTYVDVGANIGYPALQAAKRVGPDGRVYAFEPSLREFRRLAANIALNDAHNLIVFSAAVADQSGAISLEIADHHTGLNRAILFPGSGTLAGSRQLAPVVKLDEVLPAEQLRKPIDLIKIDVEGAEMNVLRGMKALLASGKIRRLCVEITPKFLEIFGEDRSTLFKFLAGYGYLPRYDLAVEQYDEVFDLANPPPTAG